MKHTIKSFIVVMVSAGMVFSCQKETPFELEEDALGGNSLGMFNPFPEDVVFEVKDPLNETVQSPSILVLPDGSYLVSFYHNRGTTIYISKDRGKTWSPYSRIAPSNFGTLFEHDGNVYLMGTSIGGRGDIVIYKSMDQGKSWSTPVNENSGLLFKGFFHTAPVPVIKHNGKIWRSYEEVPSLTENRNFHALVICADENTDLLKASSWKRTNSIRFNEAWINARSPNWLEGNIVVTPEGKLVNFMRLETWTDSGISYEITGVAKGKPRNEIAAIIDVDEKNMSMEFENKARNYIHFPGAETKFTIRYDSISNRYWAITNKISSFRNTTGTHGGNWHQRNILVLMSSTDLVDWHIDRKILRWNEGAHLWTWDTFGFQYIDWQFENEDIVLVSRTSWYGSRYHDANMTTFHRVENFRSPNPQEPKDLIEYTQHPKLFDIPPTSIVNGQITTGDFEVTLTFGEGVVQNEERKISLKNQLISKDERQAMTARRYLDIKIKNNKEENLSIETLSASLKGNNRNFRIKWMYSTDGTTFHPITNYLHRVEGNIEGLTFNPPLYLQLYRPLNKINGKEGVVLRCVFVEGNGTGTQVWFDDVISIGGRRL